MKWPRQALFATGSKIHGFDNQQRLVCDSFRKMTSHDHDTTTAEIISKPAICQLNHAGASPSPQSVVDRVQQHILLEQRIGGYAAADAVSQEIDEIYQTVATLINADNAREIALTESATVAWTRAFYAMVEQQLHESANRDVILVSDAEYAANVVAACQWARTHKWTVLSIPCSALHSGIVDVLLLEKMLAGAYEYTDPDDQAKTMLDPARIALVCITQVPTNSGIVNPVEKIGSLISRYNAHRKYELSASIYYLVDACQAVGQLEVNVKEIECHALVATGRKYLRGPRGTGFLYIASSVLDSLMPSHVDHFGAPIAKVPLSYKDRDAIQNLLEFAPRSDARRFEFWESSAASRLGFGKAVEYAVEKSLTEIQDDCTSLSRYLRNRLLSIPTLHVHHAHSSTCGIVTFYSTAMESMTLKEALKGKGFELSVVPATSTPLDSAKMAVPDLVRASLSYTNTEGEIDRFIGSLQAVVLLPEE